MLQEMQNIIKILLYYKILLRNIIPKIVSSKQIVIDGIKTPIRNMPFSFETNELW